MYRGLIKSTAIAALLCSQTALACDGAKLADDIRRCLQDPKNHGLLDMVVGGCIKSADVISDGFSRCETDEATQRNYGSCTAQEQVDTVRSVGSSLNLYHTGKCGFP